jgi:hypothetical protein
MDEQADARFTLELLDLLAHRVDASDQGVSARDEVVGAQRGRSA